MNNVTAGHKNKQSYANTRTTGKSSKTLYRRGLETCGFERESNFRAGGWYW